MKQLLLSYKICFILISLVLAITNKSIAQSSNFNNLYGPGFGALWVTIPTGGKFGSLAINCNTGINAYWPFLIGF